MSEARRLPLIEVGTASSGDRGHTGRKGKVGGSGPSEAPIPVVMKLDVSASPVAKFIEIKPLSPYQKMNFERIKTMARAEGDPLSLSYIKTIESNKIEDRLSAIAQPTWKDALETEVPRLMSYSGMPKTVAGLAADKIDPELNTGAATTGIGGQEPLPMVVTFNSGIDSEKHVDAYAKGMSRTIDTEIGPLAQGTNVHLGVSTQAYIVDHEFGHVWFNSQSRNTQQRFQDAAMTDKHNDLKSWAISSYAATSLQEYFSARCSMMDVRCRA